MLRTVKVTVPVTVSIESDEDDNFTAYAEEFVEEAIRKYAEETGRADFYRPKVGRGRYSYACDCGRRHSISGSRRHLSA